MKSHHMLFTVFLVIGIRGSVSPQSQLASFSKKLFSRSGIHEVEGPKLGMYNGYSGRPASETDAPPADLFFHHRQPSRRHSSGQLRFSFPSSSSTSAPTQEDRAIVRHSRRRLPPEYNSDIITINDILNEARPKVSSSNKSNDWIRTVGTSIHVRPDDDHHHQHRVVKGKVFDDVIYDMRSNFGKK